MIPSGATTGVHHGPDLPMVRDRNDDSNAVQSGLPVQIRSDVDEGRRGNVLEGSRRVWLQSAPRGVMLHKRVM